MRKLYNDFMNRIEPQASDEELFSSVVRSKRELSEEGSDRKKVCTMSNRKRKTIVVPIAAGAVVLAASIGVGAAVYSKNLKDNYNTVADNVSDRGQNHQPITDAEGKPVDNDAKENFDFEALGYKIDKTFEFDGYTLNVSGVITDGHNTKILYEIAFGDDFDLDDKKVGVRTEPQQPILFRDNIGYLNAGSKVYSGQIYIPDLPQQPDSDKLSIKFSSVDLSEPSKEGISVYPMKAEIIIPKKDLKLCNVKEIEVTDHPTIPFDRSEWDPVDVLGTWNLDSVFISDIALKIGFTNCKDAPVVHSKYLYSDGIDTFIHFKDGSKMKVMDGSLTPTYCEDDEESGTLAILMTFDYPIDLNDVDYLEVNENKVPIN